MTSKLRNNEAGVGVLELAMILPLLLVLVFVSVEAVRAYNSRQVAQTLSRTVGDLAFRQCAIEKGIDAEACLYDVVLPRAMGQAGAFIAGVEVVVSVYRKPTPGATVILEAIACPARDTNLCRLRSKISVATFRTNQAYKRVIDGHDIAVVAEVTYPHRPVYLPIAISGFSSGSFYDVYVI